MRHRLSGRQLNRNSSHRQAMFRNMAGSLVRHEIIKTTLPKAKELRRVVEPLITLAKTDSVANRRLAFARTRDNEIVAKLFNELGPRFASRSRERSMISCSKVRIMTMSLMREITCAASSTGSPRPSCESRVLR